MFQEKIKKIRNYLFSDENVVFAYCFGDYLKDIGYKNAILHVALYMNKKISFSEIISIQGLLSSKFYENLNLEILSNDIDRMNPILLYELLSDGLILFIKNQKIYDLWIIGALNYLFDTRQIREIINV